jgi:hypothetical protein
MSADKLVLSGDYYIKTSPAGNIYLDTGVTTGTVWITGNLNVLGIQTTIQSIDATIKDNKLVLNQGEASVVSGGSVTLFNAGITIDRGGPYVNGYPDPTRSAELLWDDQQQWTVNGTTIKGLWTFKRGGGYAAIDVGAIRLNSVVSANPGTFDTLANYILTDRLAPIAVDDPDYTTKVTNSSDPNTIPNKEYVDGLNNVATTATTAREIRVGNSSVTISDQTETGQQSFITASLNSATTFVIRPTEVLLPTIRLGNSTIESVSTNTDLTLLTNGTGVISVNNGVAFQAPVFPSWHPPLPAIGKVNVYSSSTVGAGQTGLLFNYESAQGRQIYGELVSAKKAIVLGIIF